MWTTPRQMRHVGRNIKTKSRLTIVFKQIPEDQFNALVILTDTLNTVDQTEVLLLLQSDAGQIEEDFGVALFKKGNLLEHFHKKGLLKKVHIDDIELLPEPNKPIPLRQLINQMNVLKNLPPLEAYEGAKAVINTAITPQPAPIVAENLVPATVIDGANIAPVKLTVNDKKAVAATLIANADGLVAQAEEKRKEAYKLDPTLKPKAKKAKRVRKAAPVAQATGTNNG